LIPSILIIAMQLHGRSLRHCEASSETPEDISPAQRLPPENSVALRLVAFPHFVVRLAGSGIQPRLSVRSRLLNVSVPLGETLPQVHPGVSA
jgi:hypothetical protein